MQQNQTLKLFTKNNALLSGHFLLSSGLHSDKYFQCALIFENPKTSQKLSKKLAGLFKNKKIDIVAGPALGGVILAYEVAKYLGAKAIFTEREGGVMKLRRGFKIPKGAKVLVVEDVITTGKSTNEVIDVVKDNGGCVAGVGALVDRSAGARGIKPKSLLKISVKTYDPDNCPLCKSGIPFIKPGSRQCNKVSFEKV